MPNHDAQLLHLEAATRRRFLCDAGLSLGGVALASLLGNTASADASGATTLAHDKPKLHFAPRAKSVIFIHLAGAPPQHDLFDLKPALDRYNGQPCPEEFLKGEKFAFIKGHPTLLASPFKFAKFGQTGMELSQLIPNIGSIADEITLLRGMKTDQFNHAPAQLLMHTGEARFGHPSMGAWLSYGLGSAKAQLPSFVVLVSGDKTPDAGKSVWGSGFLPGQFQGVQCRTVGESVLYLDDPAGTTRASRRAALDAMRDLNGLSPFADESTRARVEQFEMAYRMQMSVPEATELSNESAETLALYGATPGQASFANNCLLARRLVERGTRFVQLFDWGWDAHGTSPDDDLLHQLPKKCMESDRPSAALVLDLKRRGLLDETLVIWGGEFGRTPMVEYRNGKKEFIGRDHHPHCFSMWMAGGGTKKGFVHGATDELGYFATEGVVEVRDLQATILSLLGFDHERLTYRHAGLDQRLTGVVKPSRVVHEIIA
ncbi:MAG: DUF1501 domain-containing protein [Phycisphaerales bacterium]|nr:DUF1501 domain-containing protein [Phycisphaerales bacterium]